MLQLGMLLWLLVLPGAEIVLPDETQLAQGLERFEGFDPCAEARQLVAQGPCLNPEDCGAMRSWERLFGAPRTEQLDPQFTEQPIVRLRTAPSFLCLAQVDRRR